MCGKFSNIDLDHGAVQAVALSSESYLILLIYLHTIPLPAVTDSCSIAQECTTPALKRSGSLQ